MGIVAGKHQAAIAVAQGTAAQQQINFTRQNEYEADRVGISALAAAGYDPQGMASFFEVIGRQSGPSAAEVPEFLRTHPVSRSRVAEARARARHYTNIRTEDSVNYGIARARLAVARYEQPEDAVEFFERQPANYQTTRWQYGLATAYLANYQPNRAARIFEELVSKEPEVIAYHIGLAKAYLDMEQIDEAEAVYARALELFPRNVPLVVRSLVAANKARLDLDFKLAAAIDLASHGKRLGSAVAK